MRGAGLPQDSLRHASNKANEEFHTDSSFNRLPTKWSLLMAHVGPPERGDTLFVDTRAAWDALPPELQARAHGAVAEHYFWKTRGRAGYDVITDDMCTLHRAEGYDVYKYKRDLRRATINEYGPEISSTDALGL